MDKVIIIVTSNDEKDDYNICNPNGEGLCEIKGLWCLNNNSDKMREDIEGSECNSIIWINSCRIYKNKEQQWQSTQTEIGNILKDIHKQFINCSKLVLYHDGKEGLIASFKDDHQSNYEYEKYNSRQIKNKFREEIENSNYNNLHRKLVQEYSIKKKLMKIVHNLLPIAVDCQGIIEVLSSSFKPPEGKNKIEWAKKYYEEAFGNKSFDKILEGLELKGKFKDLRSDKIKESFDKLDSKDYGNFKKEDIKEKDLQKFLSWFDEFCKTVKSAE